ncbi:hypothetical protein XF24_00143 [candidate division SR1 bacterium Aalborg_AAW-1]|nr:hypothetical protein XF24_00143 [candidate division SR1 bacterium Aalborg_AAW-1]
MLFNFQAFIAEMREKEDKKEIVEKYEKWFGPIQGEIKDQQWYKEYLINFANHAFKVPEELQEEFDWKLLLQLVGGSFSSECMFEKESQEEGAEWELTISVKSGDQSVVKKVSELWSFQIMRLYEIYVEEQMNLHILIKEEEKDAEAILGQRHLRLERWKLMLESLDRDELQKAAAQEQASKMDDLMSQL